MERAAERRNAAADVECTVLLFSILVFCSAVLLAWTYAKPGLFDPLTQFLAFFALFVLPLPVRLLFTDRVEGDLSPHIVNFGPYVWIAVLLCALGVPCRMIFNEDAIRNAIIPLWKIWLYRFMPWRWKEIAPGVFMRRQ